MCDTIFYTTFVQNYKLKTRQRWKKHGDGLARTTR